MTTPEDRPARGLLDTSTLIVLPQLQEATALPVEPLILTITLAELSFGPLVARSEPERDWEWHSAGEERRGERRSAGSEGCAATASR